MALPRKFLLKELECPWCAEFMSAPILKCKFGHSYCSSCAESLIRCKARFCGTTISATSRNYVLEKCHDKMQIPCKNARLGCAFEDFGNKILEHEPNCMYEACPVKFNKTCSWRGQYSDIANHISKDHPNCIISTPKHTFTNPEFLRSPNYGDNAVLFHTFDTYFLFSYYVNSYKSIAGFSMVLLRQPEDGQKFYFLLNLINGKMNKTIVSSDCHVLKQVDSRAYFETKQQITMSLKEIPLYCTEGQLTYTVTIKKRLSCE